MSQVMDSESPSASQRPLVWVLAACSAGILADRSIPVPFSVSWGLAAVFLGGWCGLRRTNASVAATGLLLLAVALAGASWHHLCWRLFRVDELGLSATADPAPVGIDAVAVGLPRFIPAQPRDLLGGAAVEAQSVVAMTVVRVRDGNQWRRASGKLEVRWPGPPGAIAVGDQFRVFGMLSAPVRVLNPGEFDFAADRRSRRELCRIRCDHGACVTPVSGRVAAWPAHFLQSMRAAGNALLWKYVPREQAGLASAVLLGSREQIEGDRFEDFMLTGTVHVLCISGLHVGMLAAGFWFVSRLAALPRRQALMLAMVLVIWYALLTEARPPVVRAAVLICVVCLGRWLGRSTLDFNTLALAGLIVLAMNPTQLFGTGTQLSFLAVATLACFHRWSGHYEPVDPLDQLIHQSRAWPWRVARRCGSLAGRLVLASAAIWIVALPLVMYRFHLVSPIAVVLNPIIWFPMGLALFAGFGVLLFGWAVPPLAVLCGWVCDGSLSLVEACIQAAVKLPHGHIWTPAPPLWWVLVFYVGLGLSVAFARTRRGWRWPIAASLVWFALGFLLTVGPLARKHQRGELACTFVAVGHGTSVLVELPDGRTLLYDAGRLGTSRSAARSIASVLWSRGITHLDALMISHADMDHCNAVPGLLERFSVGVIYVSPVMFREPPEAVVMLRREILARGGRLREIDATSRLHRCGGAELEILHPPPRGVLGSDNANSVVLAIRYAGRTILFPGDLETPGLEDVMAELPLDCDLVMAPHHGSLRSDPPGFAAWSTPEWVVVSGGRDGDSPQLRRAYEACGARVLHTQRDGAIQAVVSGDQLLLSCWDGRRWRPVR